MATKAGYILFSQPGIQSGLCNLLTPNLLKPHPEDKPCCAPQHLPWSKQLKNTE